MNIHLLLIIAYAVTTAAMALGIADIKDASTIVLWFTIYFYVAITVRKIKSNLKKRKVNNGQKINAGTA